MLNSKTACLVMILLLSYQPTRGQVLSGASVSKSDSLSGLLSQYELHSSFSYIKLSLYKDHVYRYEDGVHAGDYYFFSNGVWIKKGDTIILKSYLDSENVSVRVKYFDSVIDNSPRNRCKKILIPMDYHNNLLYDGVVHINNDSIICHPSLDTCYGGKIIKVNVIKVSFDNGVKSRWIHAERSDFKQMQLFVDMPPDHDHYQPFYNKKCLLLNGCLKMIE